MGKCIIDGCCKQAVYGPGTIPLKAIHCSDHRETDEISCKGKRCMYPGCVKRPTFGKSGSKLAEFCSCHKRADDENVKSKHCTFPGCKKQPSYGKSGSKCADFCALHKRVDDENITHKCCSFSGCKKRANFGHPGSKCADFCALHKRADDEDVTNKHCMFPGCKKQPNFGDPGSRCAKLCADHKRPGDVNVTHKQCAYPGCKTAPIYGRPWSKRAEFCCCHKRVDDEDITSKRCTYPGCKKQPSYGNPGSHLKEFCSEHKREGDEDIKSKRCSHPGCKKIPVYGMPGSVIKEYCVLHKPVGFEDVKCSRCIHPECKKRAYYGPLYAPLTHCADHKLPGEFKERFPTCAIPECKERPSWTTRGDNYPTHCETHARRIIDDIQNPAPAAAAAASADDAQEVVAATEIIIPREIAELQCKICANVRPCDRATGLCASCSGLSEPRAWHKKREERMAQVLDAQKLIPTSADSRLEDGGACNVRSRPDFLFKRAGYTLIIEVDERQHARAFTRAVAADSTASYSCDCELARMIGIHQTLGEPTIFIRYNPDAYVDARGRAQPACADTTRDVQLVKHVARMLREFDKSPPADGLYAAYFFYDGMRASHGATLQPDRFIIDYIDQSVNPWV